MHALHQSLLPPSAVHHTLYLAHFTPSTIYPFPSTSDNIKVVGNLVVAGGQDLRVFEIREQEEVEDAVGDGGAAMDDDANGLTRDLALDDGFFDSEPVHRAPLASKTTRRLHLLANHTLHGHVTGLHSLRTLESANDGLDRMLVGFKDAKV